MKKVRGKNRELLRPFLLDVAASGHVFIRELGSGGSSHVGLPVFSCPTHKEAQALRVRHCRLARDGSGLYRLNDFLDGDVDALALVSALFRDSYGGDAWGAEKRYRAAIIKARGRS